MQSFHLVSPALADSAGRYDALFRQTATRLPDRPAMIYQDFTLTYGDALNRVERLTHGLRELGLRRGDCLGLALSNRPEFTLTFLAAASLGLIVTPINALCKEHELSYQLANAEARGIVLERTMLPALQSALARHSLPLLRQLVVLNGEEETEHSSLALTPFSVLLAGAPCGQARPVQVQPDDLLALPYSSGTSGLPKGVMLTHRNLSVNHRQFIQSLGLGSTDVALLFLPFSHIYGFMLTGSFLACGGTQVIMEQFDLPRALALCAQHRVTHFFAIPPIIRLLARTQKDLSQLESVRCIFCGASPLPLQAALQLQQKVKAVVLQGYGLTEAAPLTHAQPGSPHARQLASIGQPVEQTEQRIVDVETGTRELPAGACGELVIRGPQVMRGYWKAPEETALALRQSWLYTGDIGYLDENGYAYIIERKKEMIKHKGFSIAPAELEALLLQHPLVSEAAAIGLENGDEGEEIKGFVVLYPGASITEETLLEFANSQLAHHKRFTSLEIVARLPHTLSGKIARRQLKERERTRQLALTTDIPNTAH